jgi:predicted LPLAT superfamily acyltransferase
VVYTQNAQRVNNLFEALNPGSHANLIEMGDGINFMLKIREAIDEGSIVAIMGDRASEGDRSIEVDFLGAKARFPTGPYILASTLKCPVYLTFGLYRAPNVYELYCEPFAERIELPRRRRQEALREYVEKYAERLEHYARRYPDNWFNFYDFWEGANDG